MGMRFWSRRLSGCGLPYGRTHRQTAAAERSLGRLLSLSRSAESGKRGACTRVPVMDQRPSTYAVWAERVAALCAAVEALDAAATGIGADSPEDAAWRGQLFEKLRSQVACEPVLVAAVCGGTNTGKSLIANALAGMPLSRSILEAARTRHPVASIPQALASQADMAGLFPGFSVVPWTSDDDALTDAEEHLLFVRPETTGRQPGWLALLDTPDIDGTLRDNWARAELVRNAADLLIAVLTQQKYNDAAVRDFFQAAARAGKTVIVVFNMLGWPEQRPRLEHWLAGFAAGTGVQADAVFAIPWDRQAAEQGEPRFYDVSEELGCGKAFVAGDTDPVGLTGRQLVERFATTNYLAVKRDAMRGALEVVVDGDRGVPAWLDRIVRMAEAWREACGLLARRVTVSIMLPPVPRELVWNEVWAWLEPKRSGFDLTVSRVYRVAGRGLGWAGRRLGILPDQAQRQADHAAEELSALKAALGDFLDQLATAVREHPQLEAALKPVLTDGDRQAWFDELARRHAAMPLISRDYTMFVREELDRFERDNPGTVRLILTALNVGAVARPAVTVGLGLAGAAVVPPAAAAAGGLSVFVHNIGDLVAGAAASLAGETALEATAAGIKPLLERLFAGWAAERGDLLATMIHEVVLGDTLEQLESRAGMGRRLEIEQARRLVAELTADLGRGETA